MRRFAFAACLALAACAKPSSQETPAPTIAPIAPIASATSEEEWPAPSADLASATPPPPPPPESPAAHTRGDWGIAVAPADVSAPRPLIVYLHGMWASPEDSCSYFERAARARGVLVCPRGTGKLAVGWNWSGSFDAIRARVDDATAHAADVAPRGIAPEGGTLLGFSIGAKRAVALAIAEPGRWTSLVLMSMSIHFDGPKLAAAGVKRVALAASDDDGARTSMQRATAVLVAAGIDARFVSLGKAGHHFAKDMAERMDDLVGWARGEAVAVSDAGSPR